MPYTTILTPQVLNVPYRATMKAGVLELRLSAFEGLTQKLGELHKNPFMYNFKSNLKFVVLSIKQQTREEFL